MKNVFLPTVLSVLLSFFSLLPTETPALQLERGEEGAGRIVHSPVPFVFPLRSQVRTDHQSPRIIEECRARLKKDGTVELIFPPQLPGYYVGVAIAVKDGRYVAEAFGVPFARMGEVSYRTLRQELFLQQDIFTPGAKIEGYCDIDFVQTLRGVTDGEGREHFFPGRGLLRP